MQYTSMDDILWIPHISFVIVISAFAIFGLFLRFPSFLLFLLKKCCSLFYVLTDCLWFEMLYRTFFHDEFFGCAHTHTKLSPNYFLLYKRTEKQCDVFFSVYFILLFFFRSKSWFHAFVISYIFCLRVRTHSMHSHSVNAKTNVWDFFVVRHISLY